MDILDFIGKDIISRLSSRYPDIKFYLIDMLRFKLREKEAEDGYFSFC